MTESEALAFEKDQNHLAILDMRKYDEMAKVTGLEVPSFNDYIALI